MTNTLKYWLLTLSGYFYLLILIGNIVGYLLIYAGDGAVRTCYPYVEMWGIFGAQCEEPFAEAFWFLAITVPRFFLSPFYLSAHLLTTGSLKWMLEAGLWLLYCIPILLLIFIPGFRYWNRKNKQFSWILVMLTLVIIVISA
jgi:hypothetical protein